MTDEFNLHIGICCKDMGDLVMMNDIRESAIDIDGEFYIWWRDGDLMPMHFCPSCGKRIERLKE